MKKNITIFTFFAIMYLVSSSFFLYTKEVQAQGSSCFDGKGACMFTGCKSTDIKVQNDPACGVGVLCCVPSATETVSTCANSGGTCLLSCLSPNKNEGPKPDCGDGQTCCVASASPQDVGSVGYTGPKLASPTPAVGTLFDFLVKILEIVIKISVPVVALFFIWTGYKFVSASGDPAKLKDARHMLVGTVIATAIIFGSIILATLVKNTVGLIGG